MKFRVYFKNPDALEQAVADNTNDNNYKAIMKQCEKWFSYREMVTLEIDTVANTCTVVPVS